MRLVGTLGIRSRAGWWCGRAEGRTAWLALAFGLLASGLAAAPPVLVDGAVLLDRLGGSPLGRGTFAVGGNGNGIVVMAWLATPTQIQARLYDAAGTPRTPIIEVTREAGYGTSLATDVDAAGGFVLAWRQGSGALLARRYLADGSAATEAIPVGSGIVAFDQYASFVVDVGADGSFLAAWSRRASSTSPDADALRVRAFDASGHPKGPESVVSDGVRFSNVALSASGETAVVTYGRLRQDPPFSVFDVWARRVDSTGALRSTEVLVATGRSLPPSSAVPFGVVLYPDGRFVVGYESCDPAVSEPNCYGGTLQWVGPGGTPLSSGAVVSQRGPFLAKENWLSPDGLGNFATFTADSSGGTLGASNPLGAVVVQTEVPRSAFPASTTPTGLVPVGLVPLGPSQFAFIWYDGDWTYLQTMRVLPETTPAPSFYTVEPCRLMDTRVAGPPLLASDDRSVQASGRCSIPPDAKAIAANAVALQSSSPGNVRFYRSDRLVPLTSSLNLGIGQIRANSAVIPLGTDGAFAARASLLGGTTHLIIDVSGYFQ